MSEVKPIVPIGVADAGTDNSRVNVGACEVGNGDGDDGEFTNAENGVSSLPMLCRGGEGVGLGWKSGKACGRPLSIL